MLIIFITTIVLSFYWWWYCCVIVIVIISVLFVCWFIFITSFVVIIANIVIALLYMLGEWDCFSIFVQYKIVGIIIVVVITWINYYSPLLSTLTICCEDSLCVSYVLVGNGLIITYGAIIVICDEWSCPFLLVTIMIMTVIMLVRLWHVIFCLLYLFKQLHQWLHT